MRRKTPWIVAIALLAAAIVLLASCMGQSPKPSPTPSATPTATATTPPAPTPTPTDSTVPYSGFVTGECEIYGIELHCTIDQQVTFNNVGLALYNGQTVVVLCDENGCVSHASVPSVAGCISDVNGIYCLNIDDETRADLRSMLSRYGYACRFDRTTESANCSLPTEWELQDNQPVMNGIPLLLGVTDGLLRVYAGQVATGATPLTCTLSDTNGTRQNTLCS